MSTSLLQANPEHLTACALEDYAGAWATQLMVPVATLARRRGEPDPEYRPRLVGMIEARKSRVLPTGHHP